MGVGEVEREMLTGRGISRHDGSYHPDPGGLADGWTGQGKVTKALITRPQRSWWELGNPVTPSLVSVQVGSDGERLKAKRPGQPPYRLILPTTFATVLGLAHSQPSINIRFFPQKRIHDKAR